MVKKIIEFIKNNKVEDFLYHVWVESENYDFYYSSKTNEYVHLYIEFEGLSEFSIKLDKKLLYKSHNFFEWYKLKRFIKKEYEVYAKNMLKKVEETIRFSENVNRNTTQENK